MGWDICKWNFENIQTSIVNNSAGQGSGIQMVSAEANITESNISNNCLSQYYGGLLIVHSIVNIQNSTIANNKAERRGAGPGITADSNGPSNVHLTQCTIKK